MNPRRLSKRQALVVKWGGVSIAVMLVLTVAVAWAGRRERHVVPSVGVGVEGVTSVLSKDAANVPLPIRFQDVSATIGISFQHFPSRRQSLLPEDMGSGVACGDYDGDGWTDVYFVNFAGTVMPGAAKDAQRGMSRLFRNVHGERFEDVTDQAGVGFAGYGMGAAWGDYDNDGDLDLYVTAFGDNILYQNSGHGTFRDVTAAGGAQDSRFSAGCSWVDYDRDGNLDLYVCNYVDFAFRPEDRGVVQRQYATEQPYTLNPSSYPPVPNSLFHNNGDGTFTEVGARAGVADPNGRSLSASWSDLDGDGWPDLYVANDVSENGVFRNLGDGAFENIGASSMAADYRGAMGLAVSDFDNDLDQDLFITHWIAQENALYINMVNGAAGGDSTRPELWFFDNADMLGLGQISLDMVGWAAGFCDFDNDGRRDLWVVNGSTLEEPQRNELLKPQKALLFWNEGERGFVDIAGRACETLSAPFVGRGGARLDFNRDGKPDLIMLVHGGRPIVLENTSPSVGHWLDVELRQTGGNTSAVGARVYLTAGAGTQMAEAGAGSSYLSQDEQALHFGLGPIAAVDSLRIVWPDGSEEIHTDLSVDQTVKYVHAADYPVRTAAGLSDSLETAKASAE